MAAGDHFGARRGWLFESHTHRAFQASGCEAFGDGRRQCREVGARRFLMFSGCSGRIKAAHRAVHEAAYLLGTAKQIAPTLPLGDHFLRLQDILREAGARSALAFLSIAPARFHCRRIGRESEIETELPAAALPEHHRVHQRAGHRAAFVGQRDGDAGCLSDLLRPFARMTSSTAPSIALSGEYSRTERTSLAGCPNRSTRPSRCWWRVGFQDRS